MGVWVGKSMPVKSFLAKIGVNLKVAPFIVMSWLFGIEYIKIGLARKGSSLTTLRMIRISGVI